MAIIAVLHNPDIIRPTDARVLELSIQQWQLIEEVVVALKPFLVATTAISGDKYPTLSKTYPIFMGILTNHMKIHAGDSEVVISFKEAAAADMKSRLPTDDDDVRLCEHPVITACALDPAYKKLRFLTEEQKQVVSDNIKNMMTTRSACAQSTDLATKPQPVIKTEPMEDTMQFLLGDMIDLTGTNSTDSEVSAVESEYSAFLADSSPTSGNPLLW